MLHPDSLMKNAWDVIILLCVVYQAISVPFKLSFYKLESQYNELDETIDALFIFDIVVTFFTGYP